MATKAELESFSINRVSELSSKENISKETFQELNNVINQEKEIDTERQELLNKIDKDKFKILCNKYFKDEEYFSNIMYYDDISKLKNKSYNNIKNVLFDPKNSKNKISNELSNKYGVSIYDYSECEYTMLVRCLRNRFREESINRRDCYTLLSDLNSKVLYNDSYIYGYSSFSNDSILHIFESDSFSSNYYEENAKKTSNKVNRLMTPNQIITNDSNISEVQIINKKNNSNNNYLPLKPDFICVYDDVNEIILNEAKRLNIPIVIIRDNKLDYGLKGDIPYNEKTDNYVFSSYDEQKRR